LLLPGWCIKFGKTDILLLQFAKRLSLEALFSAAPRVFRLINPMALRFLMILALAHLIPTTHHSLMATRPITILSLAHPRPPTNRDPMMMRLNTNPLSAAKVLKATSRLVRSTLRLDPTPLITPLSAWGALTRFPIKVLLGLLSSEHESMKLANVEAAAQLPPGNLLHQTMLADNRVISIMAQRMMLLCTIVTETVAQLFTLTLPGTMRPMMPHMIRPLF
jgi:hypothetical protein